MIRLAFLITARCTAQIGGVEGASFFASLIHYACEYCFVFDGESVVPGIY